MNFMSSTNTNEKQVLSLKHVWQWDPEVVVKSFCRWGMLLVVNHHGAHISPPIILFAFYQCSLPQMCMRIKGSRKQHNEGEEGRERRDEGRERDGGGRWVAINPSSDDVRRGSREARQQQLQRERGGIQEKWWGSRTVERQQRGLIYSSQKKEKEEQSDPCVWRVWCSSSWEHHTHHTPDGRIHFQNEQSVLLSAAAGCEVEPFPAERGRNSKQVRLVFRRNGHVRGRLSVRRVDHCLWNAAESSQDARTQIRGWILRWNQRGMKLWEVRGRQQSAPALQLIHLPPRDHAGPTDRQGAGVAVQTQGQVRRCV